MDLPVSHLPSAPDRPSTPFSLAPAGDPTPLQLPTDLTVGGKSHLPCRWSTRLRCTKPPTLREAGTFDLGA